MYIPKHFLNTNDDDVIAFIKQYSFATIVSSKNGRPVATHLPFVVGKEDGVLNLKSHFAKANPQSDIIDGQEALIIFSEPHAYISPKHYEKEQSVPTWNYISVHVYGLCRVMDDLDLKSQLIDETIFSFEEAFREQWKRQPREFVEKMLRGIVAFEVEVTEMQAKFKLSQNRSQTERESIIRELSNSDNPVQSQIAEYMKAEIK
jgi:transcriptional regulator